MSRKIFIAIVLANLVFPLLAQEAEKAELPEKFKQWIDEYVTYIITPQEKEVFYALETDRERRLFIEEFWRQRDPTPGSLKNEFKEEHYRRLNHANRNFGSKGSLLGWKSAQGKIYIILGNPLHVERFQSSFCHPIELWTYQGNTRLGQAPIFRLVFFKREGVGTYELYDPLSDGPKALTPQNSMRKPIERIDFTATRESIRQLAEETHQIERPREKWQDKVSDPENLTAYQVLRDNVSFDLAEAAWSAFPGGMGPEFSLPSSLLIGEVRVYPHKRVNDEYAIEFLEHKAVVEVNYSENYINNRFQVKVLQDESNIFLVNYCIEPESLTMDSYQGNYYTHVRVTQRVTDASGKTIFQNEREFPIEMNKTQLANVTARPFNLFDSFPLIPGDYTFDLLLENLVSKEFATVEKNISVPESDILRMSSLVLAGKLNEDSPYGGLHKAFKISKLQMYPSPGNRFGGEDNLYIFFQVYELSKELQEAGSIEYFFQKKEGKSLGSVVKFTEFENDRDFLMGYPLEKFEPGDYQLRVSLLDADGKKILFQEEDFSVSDKSLPTNWIVSQANPPTNDPVYAYLLGKQFLNKGDAAKALEKLEEAYRHDPESLDFSVHYAQVLLLKGDYKQARRILVPFTRAGKESYNLYLYLGRCSQALKVFRDAVNYYQKALSQKGNVFEVLNSLGECYLELGLKQQALMSWQKSLEINPGQEDIKTALEKLQKEK